MSSLAEEKLRAREQWGQDPCGAEYGADGDFMITAPEDRLECDRYGC